MKEIVSPIKGKELESLMEALRPFVEVMSEQQQAKLGKMVHGIRRDQYPRKTKTPKFGSTADMVLEDFEERQITDAFLPKEKKFKLLWKLLMDTRFPRIGMLCPLKVDQIDWDNARINVRMNKQIGGKDGDLISPRLSPEVLIELKNWCENNKEKIEKNRGYVFFSDNPFTDRFFVSSGSVRNVYKAVRKRCGLQKVYGVAVPAYNPRLKRYVARPLYKYRLHDQRTKGARRAVWDAELPLPIVQKMGGWKDPKTVMRYAGDPPRELLDRAYEKIKSKT